MNLIRRHKRVFGVAFVATLAIAGTAAAYWTQSGSGTGSASTGSTASNIVVHQTSSIVGLFPGGLAQSLAGDFDNPNSAPVFISNVTALIPPTWTVAADPSKPPCTAADFTIAGTANVNAEVGPGTGVGAWNGLSIAMIDSATNQDNCKNVTVPINFSAN
jgi:hypothetical protein